MNVNVNVAADADASHPGLVPQGGSRVKLTKKERKKQQELRQKRRRWVERQISAADAEAAAILASAEVSCSATTEPASHGSTGTGLQHTQPSKAAVNKAETTSGKPNVMARGMGQAAAQGDVLGQQQHPATAAASLGGLQLSASPPATPPLAATLAASPSPLAPLTGAEPTPASATRPLAPLMAGVAGKKLKKRPRRGSRADAEQQGGVAVEAGVGSGAAAAAAAEVASTSGRTSGPLVPLRDEPADAGKPLQHPQQQLDRQAALLRAAAQILWLGPSAPLAPAPGPDGAPGAAAEAAPHAALPGAEGAAGKKLKKRKRGRSGTHTVQQGGDTREGGASREGPAAAPAAVGHANGAVGVEPTAPEKSGQQPQEARRAALLWAGRQILSQLGPPAQTGTAAEQQAGGKRRERGARRASGAGSPGHEGAAAAGPAQAAAQFAAAVAAAAPFMPGLSDSGAHPVRQA